MANDFDEKNFDGQMVLRTENLVKRYGKRTVVNNVSFNVKQGEIVGLLGPNGAGKTTTMRIISSLIKPDNGDVLFNGQSIFKDMEIKRKIYQKLHIMNRHQSLCCTFITFIKMS